MEWTMLLDKQSEAWTNRLSEPNFFARDILEWTDLDCGISYSGCIRMPSCDYILTKLQNMEKARQVYFILLSMHNINLISGVVNVICPLSYSVDVSSEMYADIENRRRASPRRSMLPV